MTNAPQYETSAAFSSSIELSMGLSLVSIAVLVLRYNQRSAGYPGRINAVRHALKFYRWPFKSK